MNLMRSIVPVVMVLAFAMPAASDEFTWIGDTNDTDSVWEIGGRENWLDEGGDPVAWENGNWAGFDDSAVNYKVYVLGNGDAVAAAGLGILDAGYTIDDGGAIGQTFGPLLIGDDGIYASYSGASDIVCETVLTADQNWCVQDADTMLYFSNEVGSDGASELLICGEGVVAFGGDLAESTFDGNLTVFQAMLLLHEECGALPDVNAITCHYGEVSISNTDGGHDNRINDDAPILLRTGELLFDGENGEDSSESLGAVSVRGECLIESVPDLGGTAELNMSSLSRETSFGAIAVFSDGGDDSNLGGSATIFIDSFGPGIIGGWARVGEDWAFYDINNGVRAMAPDEYNTSTDDSTWSASDNIRPSDSVTLTDDREIQTLKLDDGLDLDLDGNTLTIGTGGLIATGTSNACEIYGGTLTTTDGELILHAFDTLNIAADIEGVLTGLTKLLTKGGPGTAVITGRIHDPSYNAKGWVFVADGTLELANPNSNNIFDCAVVDRGTLRVSQDEQISDGAELQVRQEGVFDLADSYETIQDLRMYGGGVVMGTGAASATLEVCGKVYAHGADSRCIIQDDLTLAFGGAGLYRTIRACDENCELSIEANITGDRSLRIEGPGWVSFSGDNSGLTGEIIIVNGHLSAWGDSALGTGAVEVHGESTLEGNAIAHGLDVFDGGVVAPGSSPGVLQVAGTLTMQDGAIYEWEYDAGATPAADLIEGVGAAAADVLDIQGGGELCILLDEADIPETITIFSGFETVGNSVGNLNDFWAVLDIDDNVLGGTFAYEAGSGSVTWTVPEPATLSLLAIGGLALIRRRRA